MRKYRLYQLPALNATLRFSRGISALAEKIVTAAREKKVAAMGIFTGLAIAAAIGAPNPAIAEEVQAPDVNAGVTPIEQPVEAPVQAETPAPAEAPVQAESPAPEPSAELNIPGAESVTPEPFAPAPEQEQNMVADQSMPAEAEPQTDQSAGLDTPNIFNQPLTQDTSAANDMAPETNNQANEVTAEASEPTVSETADNTLTQTQDNTAEVADNQSEALPKQDTEEKLTDEELQEEIQKNEESQNQELGEFEITDGKTENPEEFTLPQKKDERNRFAVFGDEESNSVIIYSPDDALSANELEKLVNYFNGTGLFPFNITSDTNINILDKNPVDGESVEYDIDLNGKIVHISISLGENGTQIIKVEGVSLAASGLMGESNVSKIDPDTIPDDKHNKGQGPETPDNPDTPDEPDEPKVPEEPDEPKEPETPETPETPEIPETPEYNPVPETPETPEKPAEPKEEKQQEVELIPDVSQTPKEEEKPVETVIPEEPKAVETVTPEPQVITSIPKTDYTETIDDSTKALMTILGLTAIGSGAAMAISRKERQNTKRAFSMRK